MAEYYAIETSESLSHHGVKGMKWGVRHDRIWGTPGTRVSIKPRALEKETKLRNRLKEVEPATAKPYRKEAEAARSRAEHYHDLSENYLSRGKTGKAQKHAKLAEEEDARGQKLERHADAQSLDFDPKAPGRTFSMNYKTVQRARKLAKQMYKMYPNDLDDKIVAAGKQAVRADTATILLGPLAGGIASATATKYVRAARN